MKAIEDMVGLDASVLGEQIEEKTFDRIMKLAAGGDKAEEVYREGEQTQGLEDAFAELNRYVQMVKYALKMGEKVNENLYRIYVVHTKASDPRSAIDDLIANRRIVIDRNAEPRPGSTAYLVQMNGRKVRTLKTKLPPFTDP